MTFLGEGVPFRCIPVRIDDVPECGGGGSRSRRRIVPAAGWRKVDQGRNAAGWKWWHTYEARNDAAGRVLYTVLGTGRRGSYILFLDTSQADFTRHRALYKQWYDSLTLY